MFVGLFTNPYTEKVLLFIIHSKWFITKHFTFLTGKKKMLYKHKFITSKKLDTPFIKNQLCDVTDVGAEW